MSREIKFRAWDEIGRHWIYFDLSDAIGGRLVREGYDSLRLMNKGQYTGLKDKNGVDIYEGDIVVSPDYPDKAHQKIVAWTFVNKHNGFNVSPGGKFEIIGNTYENPELINE